MPTTYFPSGNPDCSSPPSLNLVTASWGREARGVGYPSSSCLGGPPRSADEGQSEGRLLSSCCLSREKEIRGPGKLTVFFHEPEMGQSRLTRKSGDGTLQADKRCGQGRSQVRDHKEERGAVLEGDGGLRAVWAPSRALSHAECRGIEPPGPAHCPLSVPLTPAPCHSLAEDANFGNRGPSCLPLPTSCPPVSLCAQFVSLQ